MISAQPWELTAALSVLEQVQQYAVTLRDSASDSQTLDAADRRCSQARRMVERIRATMDSFPGSRHGEYAREEHHG